MHASRCSTEAAPATAVAALLAILRAPTGQQTPAPPTTMVVGAHPDDETVGAGSRLPRLAQARFVCVTDGAPRDGLDAGRHGLTPGAYAETRRRELLAVLARCGIAPQQVDWLECPDQQASLRLAVLAQAVAALFTRHGTETVLTHPYDGGHPDHDATAFAVHAAAALLEKRGLPPPGIVEMSPFEPGTRGGTSGQGLAEATSQAVIVRLTPEEQRRKEALLACFATQRETLRWLPSGIECFRPAPRHDFRKPPHEGPLHYERHPWGMTGERFRVLAKQALVDLDLEPWA
jgi:LmbE family N-acetylglucosaminyl deacetylase